jgi:hypothetical protein
MKTIDSNKVVRIMFGIGLATPKWVMNEIFKKLPDDAAIVNIVTDPSRHQYGWIVASEKFAPVEEGAILPPAFVKVDGIKKTVDLHFEATADSFADALAGL